jgi:hypothetical protein
MLRILIHGPLYVHQGTFSGMFWFCFAFQIYTPAWSRYKEPAAKEYVPLYDDAHPGLGQISI